MEQEAKLGGKSPTGVYESISGFAGALHSPRLLQAHAAWGHRSCSGLEVLRHTTCSAICIWDLSRSHQDNAEDSLHPSCLLSPSFIIIIYFLSRHN